MSRRSLKRALAATLVAAAFTLALPERVAAAPRDTNGVVSIDGLCASALDWLHGLVTGHPAAWKLLHPPIVKQPPKLGMGITSDGRASMKRVSQDQ